jgi:hypothetical protein
MMPIKAKRLPSALKHGAYSEAALLPGEDPAEFKALHKGLIADLRPNGRMEEETVLSIARLTWRRQNLARFEVGQLSHHIWEILRRVAAEESDHIRKKDKEILAAFDKVTEATRRAREAGGTSDHQTSVEFVEGWKVATLNRLLKELDVEERLDAMIDRLIKRLLFVRGLKSITSSGVTGSPSSARTSLPRV